MLVGVDTQSLSPLCQQGLHNDKECPVGRVTSPARGSLAGEESQSLRHRWTCTAAATHKLWSLSLKYSDLSPPQDVEEDP